MRFVASRLRPVSFVPFLTFVSIALGGAQAFAQT